MYPRESELGRVHVGSLESVYPLDQWNRGFQCHSVVTGHSDVSFAVLFGYGTLAIKESSIGAFLQKFWPQRGIGRTQCDFQCTRCLGVAALIEVFALLDRITDALRYPAGSITISCRSSTSFPLPRLLGGHPCIPSLLVISKSNGCCSRDIPLGRRRSVNEKRALLVL